jgi:hypothetical protein
LVTADLERLDGWGGVGQTVNDTSDFSAGPGYALLFESRLNEGKRLVKRAVKPLVKPLVKRSAKQTLERGRSNGGGRAHQLVFATILEQFCDQKPVSSATTRHQNEISFGQSVSVSFCGV